ncbi:hypothetical protein HNQ93_002649 [Hymenobacter luteus]|uniref:Uncharacterized protein n=2 Tax=Hymenobacter TaxID=89966 RepID=A0A7W9T2U1_9BACT|nr:MULTISPECIES: hypothetical protein [Hymenobacter]MBB4601782.1 hypothetical protein [Hymenobacter latericoloratus]MBB6059789.1 hypothetical protein [Hymenobacter luteus]
MKNISLFPHFLRTAGQLTGLAAWQTGRLFRKAAQSALESVQEVLRAEVQKGNVQLVRDFLSSKALPAARTLLLERMTARLLVRLGLRGALASHVVGWILPVVVEQLMKAAQKSGLFDRLREHATVQDALQRLEELKRATWKRLAPDHGTGAEVLPDDTPLPPQLSA